MYKKLTYSRQKWLDFVKREAKNLTLGNRCTQKIDTPVPQGFVVGIQQQGFPLLKLCLLKNF